MLFLFFSERRVRHRKVFSINSYMFYDLNAILHHCPAHVQLKLMGRYPENRQINSNPPNPDVPFSCSPAP